MPINNQCNIMLSPTSSGKDGYCVSLACETDKDCHEIGDVCSDGSLSGTCKLSDHICEYAPVKAIAMCPATREPPTCEMICPKIYKPVCGNDAITYGNQCELDAATCMNESIQLHHEGSCEEKECSEMCPFNYDPVCGSDGITYGNKCQFQAAKCKSNYIEIDHNGPCKEEKDCRNICQKVYVAMDPVCGNDGVTYGNVCEFEKEKCKNDRLEIAYKGPCEDEKTSPKPPTCDMVCPEIYKPVCGNDAITYGNQCELDAAKCMNGNIQLFHEGSCEVDRIPETTQSTTIVNPVIGVTETTSEPGK